MLSAWVAQLALLPRGQQAQECHRSPEPVFRRLTPLLDLICIENNDSLLLVLLEQFIFLWFSLLLPGGTLSLALYASTADLYVSAVRRLIVFQ